jgi:hypothetical protein
MYIFHKDAAKTAKDCGEATEHSNNGPKAKEKEEGKAPPSGIGPSAQIGGAFWF